MSTRVILAKIVSEAAAGVAVAISVEAGVGVGVEVSTAAVAAVLCGLDRTEARVANLMHVAAAALRDMDRITARLASLNRAEAAAAAVAEVATATAVGAGIGIRVVQSRRSSTEATVHVHDPSTRKAHRVSMYSNSVPDCSLTQRKSLSDK